MVAALILVCIILAIGVTQTRSRASRLRAKAEHMRFEWEYSQALLDKALEVNTNVGLQYEPPPFSNELTYKGR